MTIDLSDARRRAVEATREWGIELGEQFALSKVSFVAAAGDAVVKVLWEHDDESLHEPEALELWGGDGAVRLLRRDADRRAILIERARPGEDASALDNDDDATRIAVDVAVRLWQRTGEPFRRLDDQVPRWLANTPTELTPLARDLLQQLGPSGDWLTHGDFHHHNVLRDGDRYVAIDPKPYLGDREWDVYTWLHNPIPFVPTRESTERRIAQFVAAGLDEFRIRAWTIVRAAFLNPHPGERALFGSLLD